MHPDLSEPEDLTFEQAISRLEEILRSMEAEQLPLEELIHSYERAVHLLDYCKERLAKAEQRVRLLMEREGGLVAEDVSPETLGAIGSEEGAS